MLKPPLYHMHYQIHIIKSEYWTVNLKKSLHAPVELKSCDWQYVSSYNSKGEDNMKNFCQILKLILCLRVK